MFYDNFIKLCQIRNVAPSRVAQDIGLNKSIVSYWKRGAQPKADTLAKIANYFDVPVGVLLNEGVQVVAGKIAESQGNASNAIANILNEDHGIVNASTLADLLGTFALSGYNVEDVLNSGILESLTPEELNEVASDIAMYAQFVLERKRKQKTPPPDETDGG